MVRGCLPAGMMAEGQDFGLVVEYYDGGTLQHVIERGNANPISVVQRVNIALQVRHGEGMGRRA